MVKHIVMWKVKEEERANLSARLKVLRERFSALVGVVPGLMAIEVGHNYKAGDFDLCLYCEFDSKESEAGYQSHPAHQDIRVNLVHPLICGRAAFDYEI